MISISKKKMAAIVAISMLSGMMLFCILFLAASKTGICPVAGTASGKEQADVAGKFSKLHQIQMDINRYSLWKVSEKQEMDAACKGMVQSLDDQYSEYYTAEEAEKWNNYINATFYGIGVTFRQEKGQFLITEVIEGSPSEKAGLKKGDIILKVDGKKYEDVEQLKQAIRGDLGTGVRLTYKRSDKTRTVSITRSQVTETTVSGGMLKGNLAYIKISSFAKNTAEEFETELAKLSGENPRGLIIDLRQNPGGYAQQALKVADVLLPECTITYIEDRAGKKTYYNSKESQTDLPYVLLVDGDSASASELVAAAVKDNAAGKLVGSRTYGKGVMQKEFVFDDGSQLKLTTHQYFSPKGHRIQEVGVEPDYKVGLKGKGNRDGHLEKAMELLSD